VVVILISEKSRISKEAMRGFLEFLCLDRILVCPVDTGKVVEYREVTASDVKNKNRVLMDDRTSYKSIKEFYFPQSELMFSFENEGVVDKSNFPGYVIFGAKPCDLEALRVMSTVYTTGKYADPFFQKRFEANFLIGVGCKELKPECFCKEMGVDREFSDFGDIMLFDDGDSYVVEFLSGKGREALERYGPTSEVVCENERVAALSDGQKLKLDVDRDDADYFDIIDWAKVTKACKGCGICTYICPTCYCFDFKDVSRQGGAERYKCWDSCMYPKFTLHASGHNPREERYQRYRQRVLHKYKYVPNNFDGAVACTGCGRCVRSCPVGINIKDITRQVMEVKP